MSPDALALVRFGLRRADDPRILDTVAIIDGELRTVTRRGPVWHRYTMDGYGETPDGSPHLVWGVGRGWPLLTGERAHYEIARGCLDRARALRRAMATQANETGLLPEQIWDADDVPSHRLYNGRPTGSAMPLVWAHAEFIKLCRSIQDGRVWDTPAEVADRYRNGGPAPRVATWRPDRAITRASRGRIVRVEAAGARTVDWCIASSEVAGCVEARDSGVGIAHADLPTAELPAGAEVRFRIRGGAEDGAREYRVRIDDR